MPPLIYSSVPGGDDDDSITSAAAGGGFVRRDTVSDSEPPTAAAAIAAPAAATPAPAAPAAAGGAGTSTQQQQQNNTTSSKLRRALSKRPSWSTLIKRLHEEPEVVTLTIHVHYFLESATYGGVPLEGLDKGLDGVGMTSSSIQKLTFCPTSSGVLALVAHGKHLDQFNNRTLMLTCESTDSGSPWNFVLTPQNAAFYARALAVPEGDEQELMSPDWENDVFDDSKWDVPVSHRDAGYSGGWDGTDSAFPLAKAVWFGPELKALFRIDVSGKYETNGRKNAPLFTAIVYRDPPAQAARADRNGSVGRARAAEGTLSVATRTDSVWRGLRRNAPVCRCGSCTQVSDLLFSRERRRGDC